MFYGHRTLFYDLTTLCDGQKRCSMAIEHVARGPLWVSCVYIRGLGGLYVFYIAKYGVFFCRIFNTMVHFQYKHAPLYFFYKIACIIFRALFDGLKKKNILFSVTRKHVHPKILILLWFSLYLQKTCWSFRYSFLGVLRHDSSIGDSKHSFLETGIYDACDRLLTEPDVISMLSKHFSRITLIRERQTEDL